MIQFINIFFIVLSIFVLIYFLKVFLSNKRANLFLEFLFLGIYSLVIILFLFPNILVLIERVLGINSAINFFVYLSIFVLFLIVYSFYNKLEKQRIEITKLTREIAILNVKHKVGTSKKN